MILVVLGTHGQPFARAIRLGATVAVPGEDIVVQHGHTSPPPEMAARFLQWCDRDQLGDLLRGARLALTHGGDGCIYQALRAGVRPIVVPRLACRGEHVDDHQLQLATQLEDLGRVAVWRDGESSAAVLARHAALNGGALPERRDLRPVVWDVARVLAAQRPRAPSGARPVAKARRALALPTRPRALRLERKAGNHLPTPCELVGVP